MSNFSFLFWNETYNQNNRTNSVKNETILDINDMDIVLNSKYAGSVLSLIGTVFIMVSYIFLCFQVRCKKKKETRIDIPKLSKLQAERYKDLKMGYGNDLIFCLSISEFICSVVSFFSFIPFYLGFKTIKHFSNEKIKFLKKIFANINFTFIFVSWYQSLKRIGK